MPSDQQEPVKRPKARTVIIHPDDAGANWSSYDVDEVDAYTDQCDRDIKALRKRGRGWKHRTWLYRERLTYEERVTLKQAKTIELLQKLLRRERYEVLHDRGCDCDLCAAVDAALKEARDHDR